MPYASATELRQRYRRGLDRDEFAHLDDADIDQALSAASAEIDSWRPAGTFSVAAAAIIADKTLTLARMLAHQDSPLDDSHPVVRDAMEVRAWLKALAAGRVSLPADTTAAATTSPSPQVSAPAEVFGATFAAARGREPWQR